MNKATITVIVIIVVIAILYFYFGVGKKETLAQCIKKSGAKFYGTPTCSHCNSQKKKFGADAINLPYIDCSKNAQECAKVGVAAYPTWVINGSISTGEKELSELAQLTGCKVS